MNWWVVNKNQYLELSLNKESMVKGFAFYNFKII
jgi:hypothetical protein